MSSILSNCVANIKSGYLTKKIVVRSFQNKYVKRILRKLTNEGLIRGFSIDQDVNKIQIHLKYDENFIPVIRDIKMISTSGHRVYFKFNQILKIHSRGEIYLISTNKGLFTVDEIVYNNLNIGGEVVLRIYLF